MLAQTLRVSDRDSKRKSREQRHGTTTQWSQAPENDSVIKQASEKPSTDADLPKFT
jgi:hypothetical protein